MSLLKVVDGLRRLPVAEGYGILSRAGARPWDAVRLLAPGTALRAGEDIALITAVNRILETPQQPGVREALFDSIADARTYDYESATNPLDPNALDNPHYVGRRLRDLIGPETGNALVALHEAVEAAGPEIVSIPVVPSPAKAAGKSFVGGEDLPATRLHPASRSGKPFGLATIPVLGRQFWPLARLILPDLSRGETYGADDAHPLVRIGLQRAQAFAEMLATFTGKPYRLPTSAEWRRAAKGPLVDLNYEYRRVAGAAGGARALDFVPAVFFARYLEPTSPHQRYDTVVAGSPADVMRRGGKILSIADTDDVDAILKALTDEQPLSAVRVFATDTGAVTDENTWFDQAGGALKWWRKKRPDQPGNRPPNPFGLFDMSGNVAEWVFDPPARKKGAKPGVGLAGGSWRTPRNQMHELERVEVVEADDPRLTDGADDAGFRLTLDLVEP